MQIYKDFTFEAAHRLPHAAPDHPNARIHGHSFRARIIIRGEPDADTGQIHDLEQLENLLADTREALDHRMLNEVDGLETPTLENIAVWLWHRLANRVPGLAEIQVHRDSCREGCIYTGPHEQRLAAE